MKKALQFAETDRSLENGIAQQYALADSCVHPTGRSSSFPVAALDSCVPARFEEQVRLHGERLAVAAEDGRLSYIELNRNANRIAHAVLKMSPRRENPVALYLESGATNVAATLAILKAGRAFVPLDPVWPAARCAEILRHSSADLLLTSSGNISDPNAIVGAQHKMLAVDALPDLLPSTNLGLVIDPDAPASILYTSGSTGEPKGVVDSHRNLLHEVMRLTHALHICPDDRQTLVRACCAGAISDTFTALLNGTALFPFDVLRSGTDAIARWLDHNKLTIWRSAPALFRVAWEGMSRETARLPHLRVVFVCGEPATSDDLALYRARGGSDSRFINCFGATETATVTVFYCGPDTQVAPGPLPVGYPVEDMQVELVNAAGETVAETGEGEIVVKSRYLARGYIGDPQRTERAFASDLLEDGTRKYFTGDWGQRLADGMLVCHGRRDWRVKVRGRTLELAEIEAELVAIDAVREAVVSLVDEGDRSRLIAYIVAEDRRGPSSRELRTRLGRRLPAFMIPTRFVTLDRIPLTTTGKADRNRLLEAGPSVSNSPLATRVTALELALTEIWTEVLETKPRGVGDDFYELGGESLEAAQIIARVRSQLCVEVTFAAFFDHPTIRELSSHIESLSPTASGASGSPLKPANQRNARVKSPDDFDPQRM